MMHITVALPDEVAQEYYNASEKLHEYLKDQDASGENTKLAPDAQTLMRFMLAGFTSDDIANHFDRVLRNITGAPMPDESDTWVFSPGFENAP
jgi:hypothetical protein